MALFIFRRTADKEITTMQGTTKRNEPAKQPSAPSRGAPATASVQSVRKDVTVRVFVAPPPPPDGEELREHGYGHGV
jgi:hypothetical protein